MPENFLHGPDVIEIPTGARPIRTVRSSVIGLVGGGVSDGVAARTEIGAANAKLAFVAAAEGVAGNDITVRAVNPGTNNAALTITVAGKAITINLATDGTGAATSTATQVRTAFNASTPAAALAACNLGSGSTGASLYVPHVATGLTGGVDTTFPLDRPVLVTNPAGIDARLGATSYLGKALEAIYTQASGQVVVVVRTNNAEGDATEMTGVFALKRAQSDLELTPRIIVAEDASGDAVLSSVKSVCASLRAIAPVGISPADSGNASDAMSWAGDYANERIYPLWPFVNGGQDPAPFVAGAIARSDNDRGFWWSPSNFEVFGIKSLDQPVDFVLGDTACLANLLNEAKIATFIREGGFRLWGNLTGSVDPKWQFLCIRRTGDMINDSIKRGMLWAVDRGITTTFFEDVAESTNGYLRILKSQGAILGGKCWPTPGMNNAADIPLGKADFTFDWGGVYPAQTLTFRSVLTNDYIEEIFA